ncbi:hypothetical protein ACROYT_G011177 [Oculina patagonica]
MQLLFVFLQAYVLWSCASGELVANADLRPALGKRDATSEDAPLPLSAFKQPGYGHGKRDAISEDARIPPFVTRKSGYNASEETILKLRPALGKRDATSEDAPLPLSAFKQPGSSYGKRDAISEDARIPPFVTRKSGYNGNGLIMVFQKRAKKCTEHVFYIGNQTIDVVQDYTYLGTKISSTGNFKISLDHLKEKGLHALFSLRRQTNFSRLKPSLACRIFDAMISPILLYNSEIWGGYVKSDFKAWDGSQIERTHLQFCKRYLEVSNKASNVACRAELGRFPLLITINQRILNYLIYLQEK